MLENHYTFLLLEDACPKFTLENDSRPLTSDTGGSVRLCVLFWRTHYHRKSPVLVAPLQLTDQIRVPPPVPSHLPCRGTAFTHCKLEKWKSGKARKSREESTLSTPTPSHQSLRIGKKRTRQCLPQDWEGQQHYLLPSGQQALLTQW